MRNFIKLPSLNNVVAGQRFVLTCPIGPTYDQIQFKLTNVTASQITNFKVKVGAKTLVEVASLQTLVDLNSYYQRVETAGYFTLWFYRPEKDTDAERKLFALGTQDVPSLTIEGTIDAGATNPAIVARAVQRAGSPMGVVTKIHEFPTSYATSGVQQIDNLPRTPGASVSAVHLGKADVSNVEMEVNYGAGQQKIIEAAKVDLEALQKQFDRTPITAKFTHVDLDLLGKVDGPLAVGPLQDWRFKPTIDTSGSLTTVVEYLEGFQGI